jgi:hypothetical protein
MSLEAFSLIAAATLVFSIWFTQAWHEWSLMILGRAFNLPRAEFSKERSNAQRAGAVRYELDLRYRLMCTGTLSLIARVQRYIPPDPTRPIPYEHIAELAQQAPGAECCATIRERVYGLRFSTEFTISEREEWSGFLWEADMLAGAYRRLDRIEKYFGLQKKEPKHEART